MTAAVTGPDFLGSESQTPMSKDFKRKKKLINSKLQLHIIAIFASLACLSALFQVLILNRSILILAERTGESATRIASELPSVLFGNLVLTLAVLMPLMLVVGILVTHRIAGPVYRFEQHMQAIARGENPGVCRIRKSDELQELCVAINAAMATMEKKLSAGDSVQSEAQSATEDEAQVDTVVGSEDLNRAA
ncbi:MAG: methyl-accepting chemotaxis protein [Planctomycetota bacterium]|jgi:methyl-accepting chemotaxis protein